VTLQFAQTPEQCVAWLLEDGSWHQQQWGAQSGFNNTEFIRFHEAWILRGFSASLCGYVRLMAGEEIAAGAYYFRDSSRLYFYLGFARDEWGPKVKTGFCLHLAMIRYCYDQGIPLYDFMGGDYAYKRRFGTEGPTLVRCRYKPPSLVNRGEQVLKGVKAQLHDRVDQFMDTRAGQVALEYSRMGQDVLCRSTLVRSVLRLTDFTPGRFGKRDKRFSEPNEP
jgi:CelD/BcsL family acetyltransferase involved in cellulose biosynthesis